VCEREILNFGFEHEEALALLEFDDSKGRGGHKTREEAETSAD
jgi:hypothetical protein